MSLDWAHLFHKDPIIYRISKTPKVCRFFQFTTSKSQTISPIVPILNGTHFSFPLTESPHFVTVATHLNLNFLQLFLNLPKFVATGKITLNFYNNSCSFISRLWLYYPVHPTSKELNCYFWSGYTNDGIKRKRQKNPLQAYSGFVLLGRASQLAANVTTLYVRYGRHES